MQKHGQIVLINGVCGVGKSTVGKALYKPLQKFNFNYFDIDNYVYENPDAAHGVNVYRAFGRLDKWHVDLLEKTPIRRMLKRYNLLLIDNFLSDHEARYLQELSDGGTLIHFILEADRGTVVDRIRKDECKDPARTAIRINGFEYNNAFLKTHFPDAIRINTVGRTAAEIVPEIYDRITERL